MPSHEKLNPPLRWYAIEPEQLCVELGSSLDRGISENEARRRLEVSGPNELPEAPPPSLITLFLSQFSSLIIWVLVGAAIVSGLLQEWVDAVAILAIVVLNAVLGFVQEFRAERSLAALRKLSIATATVIRDRTVHRIPAREVRGLTVRNIIAERRGTEDPMRGSVGKEPEMKDLHHEGRRRFHLPPSAEKYLVWHGFIKRLPTTIFWLSLV